MRTWPISRTTRDGWTYLGIPDRLGTGALWTSGDTFPTLEEVAGDDWSAAVLGAILPVDPAWAWWTRGEVYRSTKLSTASAPDEIDPGAVDRVVARRMRLDGMTLAFVPARDSARKSSGPLGGLRCRKDPRPPLDRPRRQSVEHGRDRRLVPRRRPVVGPGHGPASAGGTHRDPARQPDLLGRPRARRRGRRRTSARAYNPLGALDHRRPARVRVSAAGEDAVALEVVKCS